MEEEFNAAVWPEDPAPQEAAGCQRCGLHLQGSRMIWGEGNPKAPAMVLLDNPGAREDKDGNPFICGTRQTLQKAAFQSGLNQDDLYVTFLLKCRPVRQYDKESARSTCFKHLENQLRLIKPRFIFCLGNTATQWFFSDMDADVKDLRAVWHTVKGIAACVSWHPLAVRRRPNLWGQFLADWQMLASAVRTAT